MSNYSDSPADFKLIHVGEWAGISRRNIGILAMWLNGLGISQRFHEFVTAIFVSGNWDMGLEWEEITLKRLARNISPLDDVAFGKAYNRLKQNSPKFFEWQEKQNFVIVGRNIIRRGSYGKAQAEYAFPYFDVVMGLFRIPVGTSQKMIRKAVARAIEGVARLDKPTRQPRRRKPESLARAITHNINELIDLTGSAAAAASYVLGASPESEVSERFAQALLQIKDLATPSP